MNVSCCRSRAALRTPANPCDTPLPLCVGYVWDGLTVSLVHALPSPRLRRPFMVLVREVPWYSHVVRVLGDVLGGRTAWRLRLPVYSLWVFRHLRGLPVLVQEVSRRAWVLRRRGVGEGLALAPPAVWPSTEVERRRRPSFGFSEFNSPARRCPYPRFDKRFAAPTAGPGVRMARDAFPVGLLPSRLPAGLSRRTDFGHFWSRHSRVM